MEENIFDIKSYPLQRETYELIGICMEVHRVLGHGFLEVIYKDALEYELKKRNIPYNRERKFEIQYKEIVLPRHYNCDFLIYENIILEVKAQQGIAEGNFKQTINYLKASRNRIGLLVNFGEPSLKYKRIIF